MKKFFNLINQEHAIEEPTVNDKRKLSPSHGVVINNTAEDGSKELGNIYMSNGAVAREFINPQRELYNEKFLSPARICSNDGDKSIVLQNLGCEVIHCVNDNCVLPVIDTDKGESKYSEKVEKKTEFESLKYSDDYIKKVRCEF